MEDTPTEKKPWISRTTLRAYVNPSVAFAFTLVALTGLMMLFDVHGLKGVHKWLGVLLVVAGCLHVSLNWRPLMTYFQGRKKFLWGAAALLVLVALFFGLSGDRDDDDERSEHRGRHGERRGGEEHE